MRAAGLIVAMLLAGGSAAHAQPEQHREGEYGGVTPGEKPADKPASGKHRRPPPKDELTWIGFQAKDGGGGELFFQAPGAFTVSQKVEKGQVVVLLEGLRRQIKNARRPLDTRFFDTPIARVTARPAHKAIEVRIAFKSAKDAHEATVRTATGPDGLYYAYLDFGAGGHVDVKPSEPSAPDDGSTDDAPQ